MSHGLRFVAPAAALLLGPALVTSCGPSAQSIYEGDVRFEHCYRLDLELDVASSHRQACWTTWLDRYTYGQSRDRLEYARRRVRAFAGGDIDRPALKVGQNQEQDSRQFYLVVPSPTSVHAPPPPIATRVNVVEPPPSNSAEARPVEKPAPGEDCAEACKNAFSSCNMACDPAAKSAACKSCDPDYKKCMARCFE
ncbi:MAG TPA: hypothetical protein VHP33_24595 [Polyangiaceae bacterium]|nr:hypothetical protein [Polyangiaceae bacterium]